MTRLGEPRRPHVRKNAPGGASGYDQYGDPTLDPRISIFEPYNEDTWWHNGYDTAGAHSVDIGKIFDATICNYGQLGA